MFANATMVALRSLDPERAHNLALTALRSGLTPTDSEPTDPALEIEALGCRFRNPIGLAAGFDKDAVAISGLARVGFGFLELGTVTPRPQSGNPKPRLFRLSADQAVINRMGFNSAGVSVFVEHLAASAPSVPLGANLGINKDHAFPERDYAYLVRQVAQHVQYVVLNVSSPNTPGLRDLQAVPRLQSILQSLAGSSPANLPLLVKLSPDLSVDVLPELVEACVAGGVKGLIVSNTTIARPPTLRSALAREKGGLSGAPLFELSTALLARVRLIAGDRLTLVGVGGIRSGQDAFTKIRAGASLVQLYTAFVYKGPTLIPRLKRELTQAAISAGFRNIQSAIGTDAERLARMAS